MFVGFDWNERIAIALQRISRIPGLDRVSRFTLSVLNDRCPWTRPQFITRVVSWFSLISRFSCFSFVSSLSLSLPFCFLSSRCVWFVWYLWPCLWFFLFFWTRWPMNQMKTSTEDKGGWEPNEVMNLILDILIEWVDSFLCFLQWPKLKILVCRKCINWLIHWFEKIRLFFLKLNHSEEHLQMFWFSSRFFLLTLIIE